MGVSLPWSSGGSSVFGLGRPAATAVVSPPEIRNRCAVAVPGLPQQWSELPAVHLGPRAMVHAQHG